VAYFIVIVTPVTVTGITILDSLDFIELVEDLFFFAASRLSAAAESLTEHATISLRLGAFARLIIYSRKGAEPQSLR
jgi:hypothetical protein